MSILPKDHDAGKQINIMENELWELLQIVFFFLKKLPCVTLYFG